MSLGDWRITRRRFLEMAGASAALVACETGGDTSGGIRPRVQGEPGPSDAEPDASAVPDAEAPPRRTWFTETERAVFLAAAEVILPDGEGLGARENEADAYVERLLTALDVEPPDVFAGGPYSGRHPFADPATGRGGPSHPPDAFREFVPLTRVQRLTWTALLEGTAAVPELAVNDAALGAWPGLRAIYRDGLARLVTEDADFTALSLEARAAVMDRLEAAEIPQPRTGLTFMGQLVQHVCEAVFGDPVYGGNRDAGAWRAIGFGGDSQPLGYSQYVAATETWTQRAEAPLSAADPDDAAPDFDADTEAFLRSLLLPRRFD